MPPLRTISFIDADSGDDAFVSIRVEGDFLGLAVSLKSNGDIQVFMGRQEVHALIEILGTAEGMIGTAGGET